VLFKVIGEILMNVFK